MLDIQNLRTGYDTQYVLDVPELTVAKGARCLLYGRSGSGKTTLLYTIAGLADYMAGAVKIDGRDIYSLPEARRDEWRSRTIGIIFQDLYLLKPLSVLQNIVLGSFVQGAVQDKARAEFLLDRLGIAELAHRPAGKLSRGQAQRVAIARAVYQNPRILLADEPTSSLDKAAAEQVMSLLADICLEMEMTLIVSSHDERIVPAFNQTYLLGGAA